MFMPQTFGSSDQYYSVNQTGLIQAEKRPLTELEKRFAQFLDRYDPQLTETVERAFKKWNNVIRDCLRAETAFRLTVGEDTQAVPVRVQDGLPAPFAEVLRQFDPREWDLLLNRAVLGQSTSGIQFLLDRFRQISEWEPIKPCPAQFEEVHHTGILLATIIEELQKLQLLKQIRTIERDILGAYFFRVPEIHLYWMVIGFFAGYLAVPVEALTVVVAAHELAHAYTHLGRDIDGDRWNTQAFAEADAGIVEGLAQFYAEVVSEKLMGRFPEVLHAYKELLGFQSGPYTVHKDWKVSDEAAGEVVRISMVRCRSNRVKALDDFNSMRAQHLEQLKKRRPKQDASKKAD